MGKIKVINEGWNSKSAVFLLPTCNEDYTINDLAVDIQSGQLSLFNVYENGRHCASMALRLEKNTNSNELVVVAVGGKLSSGDLIQKMSDFWDDLALKNNASKIRAHVSKKGMAKLMERVGGVLSEYVYRKEVQYGR